MRTFVGFPVSAGYGHGRALVYRGTEDLFAMADETATGDSAVESRRFAEALPGARRELRAMSRLLEEEYGESEAHILSAHFLMLEDPVLLEGVRGRIEGEHMSAEAAVVATVRDLERRFGEMSDPYLRERALDIRDIGARILHHLADRAHHPLARLPEGSVIVADRLLPSDTIFLDRAKVAGMVTERGGENSHAAVLARSMGIPSVTQVQGILTGVRTGDLMVVDGVAGRVVVDPDHRVAEDYARRARVYRASIEQVSGDAHAEPVTRDGVRVRLMANIGRPEDVQAAWDRGAEGIGLLRTEFLYLSHGRVASEDEQEAAYRQIALSCGDRPFTIRTVDPGPDKVLPLPEDIPLMHAAITERGVHYSLRHSDLFRPQLRAILRASRFANVRILLPMVTGVHEIHEVRRLIDELQSELRREGIRVQRRIEVGAMIETPPAVLMATEIARAADFLSVGSNDLLRYLFTGDWEGDRSEQETTFEPSLLRAIEMVVKAGETTGKEITLCGEMAGDPAFTALLLGLGLRVLSMSPERIPKVRYNIRQVETRQAAELAQNVIALPTAEDVRHFVLSHASPWHQLVERFATGH